MSVVGVVKGAERFWVSKRGAACIMGSSCFFVEIYCLGEHHRRQMVTASMD